MTLSPVERRMTLDAIRGPGASPEDLRISESEGEWERRMVEQALRAAERNSKGATA